MTRLNRILVLALITFAMTLVACGKKDKVPDTQPTNNAPAAQTKVVDMFQYRFNPNTLSLSVGDSVTFRNKDPERHNVRIAALNVDQMVDPNQDWTYTFDTKGEFAVDNRLATNPMSMTIVVQ